MKYTIMALTKPVEGREQEFNDWYDKHHLKRVLAMPGFLSAQRFELAPIQRWPEPPPYSHLAIYELETDDLAKALAPAQDQWNTEDLPRSDAIEASTAWVFQPIASDEAK